MIIKLLDGKIGFNLRRCPIPFVALLILKELRNYKRKLFLCLPQISAVTQPTFETAASNQITSNQISTYRKQNLSLLQAVYNTQKT